MYIHTHVCGNIHKDTHTHTHTHTHAHTQLWDAASVGDGHMTLLLESLGRGARVDWRDAEDRGNSALHKAAEVLTHIHTNTHTHTHTHTLTSVMPRTVVFLP